MELFVYSDESGVFDRIHNDFYVYGGYIFLGKEERDIAARKYAQKERNIQSHYPKGEELKACYISNKDKLMLFKRMNGYVRFGAVVSEKHIEPNIFTHKKTKQRYLDYVYKMTLKNALIRLNEEGLCKSSDIDSIYVFVDEHTTATDGKYELKEALLQELKYGTFNMKWSKFFKPIMPQLKTLELYYRNSESVTLIRAADIFANRLFYYANNNLDVTDFDNTYIKYFP